MKAAYHRQSFSARARDARDARDGDARDGDACAEFAL